MQDRMSGKQFFPEGEQLRGNHAIRHVIIGTSAAGLAAAETLRRLAPDSPITLISEEPHLPYSRPLLTYLLGGRVPLERIWLRGPDYFHQWGFQALLGAPVAQVDLQAREVRLAAGRACPFDRLLIASGAQPRRLGLPGEDLAGVYTLRHLADWHRLAAGLPPEGGTVTVVGAGPVGLKSAEALAHRGLRVNLVEVGPRVLPQLLDDTAASLVQQTLESMGIRVFLHSQPQAVLGDPGRVRALGLADGRELAAEAVLMAVGVTPRVDFLAGTGLAGPSGVGVDAFLKTRHENVFAAGDCIQTTHLLTGARGSFQIWPAAAAQGEIAGANLAGAGRPYAGALPQNSISLGNFKVMAGGLIQPEQGDTEVVSELDRRRGHYRRLVFQQGRLVGLILAGAGVTDAGIYFRIMSEKFPTGQLNSDPHSPDFHPGKLWG